MPLYAYRCTQCGYKFEKIQKFSAKQETVCPKCHGALERPLTAPAFNFKGSGWYVNDYPSTGGSSGGYADAKEESKSDSTGTAKESKPASPSNENKPSTPSATPAPAPTAGS